MCGLTKSVCPFPHPCSARKWICETLASASNLLPCGDWRSQAPAHMCMHAHTHARTHTEVLGGTVTLATCDLTWTQASRSGLQALPPQEGWGAPVCEMLLVLWVWVSWVGLSPQKLLRKIILTLRAIGDLRSPGGISSRVKGGEPSWEGRVGDMTLVALSICQHKDPWSSAQSCLYCHSVWVVLRWQPHCFSSFSGRGMALCFVPPISLAPADCLQWLRARG